MTSAAVALFVDNDFEPAENWDDDFEFNATPGPSTPASSARTRRSQRLPHGQHQGPSHNNLTVHAAGKRNSVTSMEDWDAESIVQGSPQRVTTSFTGAILGSGGEHEEEFDQTPTKTRASPLALSGDGAIIFHDPHALPVSLSIALAPWSEEPETLLPRTPVKTRAPPVQPTAVVEETENWDQDFQESDEPAEDAPRKKLSLRTRLEEEALESWDDEFALEEAEAEARQGTLQQMDLGMGPPPPASRRTPKKSPIQQRRMELREKHGSSSSGSSSDSEGEAHHAIHSYRRQKPNRHSMRSSKARRSWSEDGDFYDSSEDDEFGMRRGGMGGEEEEEDKTVTSRSSKSLEFLRQRKDSSPPPPVPKLPDSAFKTPSSSRSPNAHYSPASVASGPSLSPMIPFSAPPFPSASSPTPFPRSPTSSVFSMPGTVAETRSYTSTTHLRPIESRASSGGGTLANLSPSPPAHKDRERRRLRKKSRPSHGHTFEMGTVSGRGRPRKSGESIAAYPYSFSDGELEDIRERDRERELEEGAGERIVPRRERRTPSPPLHPHASGMLSVPGVRVASKSDDGHSPPGKQREEVGSEGVPVPPTPKGAGALLSRIGSLTNRLGGRKKRGTSVAPIENENQIMPRPQSSRSSLHLPHDPNTASPGSGAASLNPNPPSVHQSSSSWFFRSSSNTSRISAPSSHKTGRKSLGSQLPPSANGKRVGGDARASLSVTDLPNHDESEYEYGQAVEGEGSHREWEYNYEQEWDGADDRTPVATPSKLVKRKSLGFVQLRRNAIAGGEKHKLKVKDREREGKDGEIATVKKKKRASDVFMRTTPSKEGKGDPFVVPFVASASASSYASSTPYLNASTSDQSPNKDESPAHKGFPSPSGIRGIMGNVRRLSIVGAQAAAAVVTTRHRHKRTQSSSAVPGGSTSPDSVARASLNFVRDKEAMVTTPIRPGGVSGLRRRETERDGARDKGERPLTPSTSVPALQRLYSGGGPAGTSKAGHGRKRSGTDVGSKSWADRRREEKENCPVVTDSGTSGAEHERDSEKEKELVESAAFPPPIELQPPSPQKGGERGREGSTQHPSLDGFTLSIDAASQATNAPSTSGPTSSSTLRAPRPLRDHSSPQSASVGRASPLQPPPPSAFNNPLSSSTTSNASTVKESKAKDPLASAGASSSVLRRNSLGDLKIPARISQAQVSLRRDLGMVREFAGAVESLKGLQDSYHALSGELHSLLERHAQVSAAAQTQAAIPSPASVDSQSRPPSSSGFFTLANLSRPHLKLKGRKRSNTNPELSRTSLSGRNTPYNEEIVNSSSTHLPLPPGPSTLAASQAAYKDLATALYCINSKYKISWECADLLIELGSGTTNTDAGAKSIASAPLVASSSASAVVLSTSQPISPQRTASGRERAITLAGDDRDASRASTPASMSRASSRVGSYGLPGHAPPIASPLHGFTASHSTPAVPGSVNGIAIGPPLASPASWRASTGRNDLSQRQLALLRDMLGSERSSHGRPATFMGPVAATSDDRNAAAPKSSPSIFEVSQPISPNREWRWGADAMSSTITLPLSDDEEDGQTGTDRTGDRGKGKKPKKKRLMNMSGFRDMLRALRRTAQSQASKVEPCKQHNAVHGQQALLARSGAAGQSTASLSAESSFDGHSLHSISQHRDQRVHQHRAQQPGQPSQAQRRVIQKRRPKSSAGPEEILAHQRHLQQLQESQRPPLPSARPVTPPPSFSMTMPAPPKSPRRPSLASIFRIGTKSSQQQSSSGNVTDSNASYANGNSSSSYLDGERRGEDDAGEEEWDQIDAVSDLDGLDTTIRGAGSSKPQVLEKKMKKRMMVGSGRPSTTPAAPNANEPVESGKRSPYLQQDPYAYRSTSGLGRRVVSAGAATPNSANVSSTSVDAASNASQASLGVSSPVRGAKEGQPPVTVTPSGDGTGSVRQTKLSDVQENEAGEAATRASASLSRQTAQAFVGPKGPGVSPHTSRSVSASSKFTSHNTGSVRSMLPQAFSPGPLSSGPGVTPPYTAASSSGNGGTYPDIKLTFTPENIKPLLENAKEVQKALRECVEELRELVRKEEARLGGRVEGPRQAVHDRVSSA